MHVIEAPQEYQGHAPAVFLAGGISDTENWQREIIHALRDTAGVLLNPRRAEFPMDDPDAGRVQIEWEHRHLRRAGLVAFWFPPQTLCPIALFELGLCVESGIPLAVGTHPDYARRFDIEVQMRLRRPGVLVVDSLIALAAQIRGHVVFGPHRVDVKEVPA